MMCSESACTILDQSKTKEWFSVLRKVICLFMYKKRVASFFFVVYDYVQNRVITCIEETLG